MTRTPEEIDEKRRRVIRDLKLFQRQTDVEAAHDGADECLVDMLEALGEQEIVDEYEKVQKWYG